MKPVKYIIPYRELFTTKEIGDIFKVTDRQVRKWIFDKDVPYTRSGRGRGYKIPFYCVVGLAVSKLFRLSEVPKFWELVDLVSEHRDFLSKHIFILFEDKLVPLTPSLILNEVEDAFVFEVLIPAMAEFSRNPFLHLFEGSKNSVKRKSERKKLKHKRILSKKL